MKRIISLILSLVMICVLVIIPTSASNQTCGKELTIVFSHDMHSYIDTHKEKVDGKVINQGGFAKIKTVIDDIKAKNPNTLVVDGGDFSMGTLYQSIFTNNATEFRLLGLMGFDATTLGNHEFDYGSDGIAKMIDAAVESGDPLPAIVNNNINWEKSKSKQANQLKTSLDKFGKFNEYIIVNKGNVKIAIFGGLGNEAIKYTPNSNLVFDTMLEKSKQTVENIKEKENPDIIVCLSHSGISSDPKKSEDEILAREVPDIDFIVSGHTHSTLEKPLKIGNTYIGCVGEYGKNIGQIDLEQNKDGSWKLENYSLININDSIKPNNELQDIINANKSYLNGYTKYYGYESADQVLAYSPYDFNDVNTLYSSQNDQALGNLITDSFVYAVKKAEDENYDNISVAVVPVGVIRSTFFKGPIKVSDVFKTLSLGQGPDGKSGYPLVSVYLTGKEIKTVAEIDASISPMMNSAQLYISGLKYEFNPNRLLLNKVTDVKLINSDSSLSELEDDKLYRAVADIYNAQMLGSVTSMSKGLLKIIPKDKNGKEIKDFNKYIIKDKQGREVKEWTSLALYLSSFDKKDGLPTIPAKYQKAQNRKVVNDSKNIGQLLRKPNKIFFIALVVLIILILLLVLLIKLIIKLVKKSKNKGSIEEKVSEEIDQQGEVSETKEEITK